jgi:hypothetical protein
MEYHHDKEPKGFLSKAKCAFAAIAILACSGAFGQIEDKSEPIFSFRGFGTLGLTHVTEERADLLPNPLVEFGAGYTDSWSYKMDSRLGAQVDARFNSQFSGLLQVTSEQRHDGSFQPQVELANLKYQPTSDLSIQMGRVVLASFMISDYRLVGYANHWVRPPTEVYNLIPITHIDGVNVRYRERFNEVTNTTQLSYGDTERKGPDGIVIKSKNGWGFTNITEYGAAAFNVTYQQGRLDTTYPTLQPLFSALRSPALGPLSAAGTALADKYDPDNKKVTFVGVGASYDPGHWFMRGEWGRVNTRSLLGERSGWYVTSGYRAGSFTPYFIYSQSKVLSATSDPGLPPLSASIVELNNGLNQTLGRFNNAQKTLAAGIRWDFAKQAALKLQFDHVDLPPNSYGALANIQPGFTPGGSYNVISFTLDFLF